MINLDVRAQVRAINHLVRGFSNITNPFYAKVDDDYVSGFHYHKELIMVYDSQVQKFYG